MKDITADLLAEVAAPPVNGPIRGPTVRALANLLAGDVGFPAWMLAGEDSRELFDAAVACDAKTSA